MVRGELDFAIVPGPPDNAQVTVHAIADVRFTWMAAPQRVKAGTVFKAKDLATHPVITMSEGSGLSRALEAWASDQGLRLNRIVASNSLMAILGLTIADVGISFLPEAFTRPWVSRGALVSLRSSPALPTLRYCFLHRHDDNRALLGTLLACVLEEAAFDRSAGFF